MNLQLITWHIRWLMSKRWRDSTRCRVLRERLAANTAGKPFKMTVLRRFVMDRLV